MIRTKSPITGRILTNSVSTGLPTAGGGGSELETAAFVGKVVGVAVEDICGALGGTGLATVAVGPRPKSCFEIEGAST